MDYFIYEKENFIYVKNNSIPSELCKSIIKDYDENTEKNICFDNETYYEITNNKNINFLMKELDSNIEMFLNKINCRINFNYEDNYNKRFYVLSYECIELPKTFSIKKQNYKIDSYNIITDRKYQTFNKMKLFKYIWVLNKDSLELLFWNKYKVFPDEGTLIIFPVSWCFPCEELYKLNMNIYTISGYVYLK